jgi:hypothetical protein
MKDFVYSDRREWRVDLFFHLAYLNTRIWRVHIFQFLTKNFVFFHVGNTEHVYGYVSVSHEYDNATAPNISAYHIILLCFYNMSSFQ